MMQSVEQQYLTPEEYLEREETAKDKSEYINGQIIPMADGSTNHNRLAGNFYAALHLALNDQDYDVFIGDVRLWIPQCNVYTYPDIMIISGEAEYHENRNDTIINPQVIIEILSPSTRGYDKDKKFKNYRTIPSFQEYILVTQTQKHVDQYVKVDHKQWSLYEYNEDDDKITLQTVPIEITLADLYKRVKFPDR
ncbi:Uma2 family endonuclease [Aphanothece hegewaldii]